MTELRLSRWFGAPPDRVFEASTDSAVLRRWWAGRYRLAMTDTASGETRTVVGEYTTVERPWRLVYTWRWEGMPAETLVGFLDEQDRDMHTDGWRGCLDNLGRRVFPRG